MDPTVRRPRLSSFLLFFVTALVTVALILVYVALSPGDRICVGPCGFEVRSPGLAKPWAPFVLTYSRLGKWAAAGVGLLLAGSFSLLLSLFQPRKFDSHASGVNRRRINYRLLDVLVLNVLSASVFLFGVKILAESRMPWSTARWITISLLVVVPFLYEFLPRALPRWRGKWWPQLQVVSVTDGRRVGWLRSGIRALVTSFVFSVSVDLAVVLWKTTLAYEPWLFGVRMLLFLAIGAAVTHARGRGIHDVVLGTYVQNRPEDATTKRRIRGGLRLRPIEFSATEADPFVGDVLGRRVEVEAVAAMIMGTDGAGSLMVDAPWGSGKTAFLRMCAAHLKSQGITVVEFNAWTEQYTKRPLLDLVGALSTRLPGDTASRIQAGASELMTLLNASQPGPPVVTWDDHRLAVDAFRESLRAVADQNLLVVIVDELDRCEPDYGIETLADIHHLFSVPGVVVLLGVNGTELCKSIESR